MSLDVTVAGENSESYGSVEEADTYFGNHWLIAKTSAWENLDTGVKELLLKAATNILENVKVLDRELGGASLALPAALRESPLWNGQLTRYNASQRLQFPRNIDIDSNLDPFIPTEVKQALFEQAIYMTSLDETAMVNQMNGLLKSSIEAGPVRVYEAYAGDGASASGLANAFAPMAIAFMKKFIRRTRRLERG